MSINALPTDTFIGIASFTFPGSEVTQKEMSLLSLVCSLWRNQFVHEICSRQLGKKTALTLREVEIYQKRLSATPNDWECVFKHCKQLNNIDFSSPAVWFNSPPMENGKLRKMSSLEECAIELIFNSIKINCLNIQFMNLAGNPKIDAFKYIEHSFPKLIILNAMKGGPLHNYPLNCAKIQGILNHCKQLTEIEITGHLTGKEIIFLKNEWPNVNIIDRVFDFESEFC